MSITRYLRNVIVASNQLINAVFGGMADETMSSRMGRAKDCKLCDFICRVLGRLDPDHCAKAAKAERDGKYLPPELRD